MTHLPEGARGAQSDADLIRRQLEALGLSQREAARQLGVDDRSMRYYCSGKLAVPPTIFLALRQLEAIRDNDKTLALLEDGTLSTSDGELSAERLRDANRVRRAALDQYMEQLRVPADPAVLPVPDELEAAYEAVDESSQPIDELQVASDFRKVVDSLGRELEPAESRGVYAVVAGLLFISRRSYGRPVWEMHWQPLSTWVDDKDNEHHSPAVQLATDDTVREWSRRGRRSEHPVLRARYADLAWEVAKYRIILARQNPQAPKPCRPNADDARRAIDAHLEIVGRKLARDAFSAWHYLGRAVELAATIRDADRLQRAKDVLFRYQSECEASDSAYPFWQFDEIVWEHRDALSLTSDDKAVLVAVLERALKSRADQGSPKLFDPYIAQDAADRLGRWRRQLGEDADARRAANTAGLAFEAAAEQARGFTAIALLERQAARYRNAGDLVSAARLEQAIRDRAEEAESELKRVETRVEIPKDKLDAWADGVAGPTLEEGLKRLAIANLIRKNQAETGVRDLAEKAVLQARVTLKPIRPDGFSGAEIGSVEDDLDGRAIHHAANLFAYSTPFLNAALDRLLEKHSVDLDRLISALAQSPLFPPSRQKLVREGLAGWFSGDWVKAVHVLLPQIEGVLRDLLAALGGPVMKPDRNYGGFQTIGLGEVLSHELFRNRVPEDMRFHLRVLLQDPRGANLRNETAHGLASHEIFGRGIADWVVHALVLLGVIRLQPATAQEEGQKPDREQPEMGDTPEGQEPGDDAPEGS